MFFTAWPMLAACLGLYLLRNLAQCISCGDCSKYCEMGIDVRAYPQRGQNIVRASVAACAPRFARAACSRSNTAPVEDRTPDAVSLLGEKKSGV